MKPHAPRSSARHAAAGLVLALAASACAQPLGVPVLWPAALGGNGHAYRVYAAPAGIDWASASTIAAGAGGYLATITSAAENAFVYALAAGYPGVWATVLPGGTYGPWIGGVLSGAGWGWVTGEPFAYSNWDPGEPNNACTGQVEERIHFATGTASTGPTWNDFPVTGCALITTPRGFIVEFPTLSFGGPIPPLAIPDGIAGCIPGAPVSVPVVVPPGTPPAASVALTLGISHTWYGDLKVTLTPPGGFPIAVLVPFCEGSFDDDSDLAGAYVLADGVAPSLDAAALASGAVIAPGVYAPDNALNVSLICPGGPAGVWTVTFQDFFAVDTGTVSSVTLTFVPGATPVLTAPAFAVCQSMPGGPISFVHAGGIPGGVYFNPVVVGAGFTPGGWFYGLNIAWPSLLTQASYGAPFFTGVLGPTGGSTVTIPGGALPAGFTFGIVGLQFSPATMWATYISPAFDFTVM